MLGQVVDPAALTAAEKPGFFASTWGSITGAASNLAKLFPDVAVSALQAKAAEAAAKIQQKTAEAKAKEAAALAAAARAKQPIIMRAAQTAKWVTPVLVIGGLAVGGYFLLRKKK